MSALSPRLEGSSLQEMVVYALPTYRLLQISYVLFSVFLSMFFFLTKIELSIENFRVVRRKLKHLRDFVGFCTLVLNELRYSLGDYFGIFLMVHHIALGLILPFYNVILSANGDSQAITESIREVIAVIIMKTSVFYKRNDRLLRQQQIRK